MGFVEEDVFGGFGEAEEFVFGLVVVGLMFNVSFFGIEVNFCRWFSRRYFFYGSWRPVNSNSNP